MRMPVERRGESAGFSYLTFHSKRAAVTVLVASVAGLNAFG